MKVRAPGVMQHELWQQCGNDPSPARACYFCEEMTISIDLSDEMIAALASEPDEAAAELRMAAAVKLYELGRMSSGVAAELAGMPRIEFLTKLADYGVSTFRQSRDELTEEVASA
jgi:predicted HTH domain antitoxin